MTESVVYPIHLLDGKLESTLPELVVMTPPKRSARGREGDQLILQVHLIGQSGITQEALQDWLIQKASVYHKTAGTVTNAMRAVTEAINTELLDRNLKRAGNALQVNGSLALVIVKKNILYSLVIGQARIFYLGEDEPVTVEDSENHPRGLGVNESLAFRFSQAEIKPNTTLLISPIPVRSWNRESLVDGTRLSVDALARRLFNQVPLNLTGTLLRLNPGSDSLTISRLNRPAAAGMPATYAPLAGGSGRPESTQPANSAELPQVQAERTDIEANLEPEAPLEDLEETPIEEVLEAVPAKPVVQVPQQIQPDEPEPARRDTGSEFKARVGDYVRSVDSAQEKVKNSVNQSLGKVFPGQSEGLKLPKVVLLFIAIAIPMLVIAIASSVYISKGKSQQFELFYIQAQQAALQADGIKNDPATKLASLQQSLQFLNKAEDYGGNSDSEALRYRVQTDIDRLQGVTRLGFTELAEISITSEVKFTQLVATGSELYLLDEVSGRAFRYALSGAGYELDKQFDCGPNPDNPLNAIGKLVDIAPITLNNMFNAKLLAIDSSGNIEYCIPGEPGSVTKLIPPESGWRGINAISLSQNFLYVLDPANNAVQRYTGKNMLFEEAPTFFFDDYVPDLSLAIDMEVNGDELYVLRSSGDMVECTYSHMKDYKLTECTDPAPYGDMRSGKSGKPITFPSSLFTQMRLTQAPDSSIYMLDSAQGQLFHFSLQRNLQKIMKPDFHSKDEIPVNAATAIAVSPGKVLFFAFQHRVYSATLP